MSHFQRQLATLSSQLAHPTGGASMMKALTDEPTPRSTSTVTSEEFMAKALTANREGRISSAEVSEIESAIARGQAPRNELVKAVVLGTPPGLRGEHDATFARLVANWSGAETPMAKAVTPAVTGRTMDSGQFMAKALFAQAAGRLNGGQVATLEAHVNAGKQPPAELVRAVLEAEAA
jgi:hypothetical protein